MDNQNKSGAVRSADADLFSYSSLPMLGLVGVARTAAEGKAKYGRLNYKQGMPVHQYLDHAWHHMVLYTAGDRSQPNLEHAAWGLLAAIESAILFPEMNAPHELGPGSTITPEIKAELDRIAPDLAVRRKSGEFAGIGSWRLADLDDVRKLLLDRALASLKGIQFAEPDHSDGVFDPTLTRRMAEFLAGGDEPRVADAQIDHATGAGQKFDRGIPVADDAIDIENPTDEQTARLRDGLERRLRVTDDNMAEFEASKLKPMTDEEWATRNRISSTTEAAIAAARLAAGWALPEKQGMVETCRFIRNAHGKLDKVSHVTTFPDGSAFDNLAEQPVA